MGEGNVNIEDYVHKYARLCPGRALSMECIVMGPRMFPYKDPKFWNPYRTTPGLGIRAFRRHRRTRQAVRSPSGAQGPGQAARARRPGSQHRLHQEAIQLVQVAPIRLHPVRLPLTVTARYGRAGLHQTLPEFVVKGCFAFLVAVVAGACGNYAQARDNVHFPPERSQCCGPGLRRAGDRLCRALPPGEIAGCPLSHHR